MNEEVGLPRAGDVVAGKYRVHDVIGGGGMGTVYRATQEPTRRQVALKWLRPELAAQPRAARRFIREAQASARIKHPNVVDIYDVGEQDGQAFLVLELLEGESLRALLRRVGMLGAAECLALLLPAMRGVAAAHARGVVHRDIKPDNLFITRDADDPQRPVPKVLDFGISKVAADSPLAEGTLTATGATLGTPHYMSLEQLQGEEADERSDVYAFGVVLYECLTGRRPFEGERFSAIVVKVATEEPRDPRALRAELPESLCRVVMRAMARQRDERHVSMQELVVALEALLPELESGGGGERTEAMPRGDDAPAQLATRTSPGKRSPAPVRRAAPLRWPLVAAGVASLSLGALWLLPVESVGPADPAAGGATLPPATPLSAPAAAAPAADAPAEPSTTAREAPAEARATTAGADTRPTERAARPGRFGSGWVYLGKHAEGRWAKRHFDGWSGELPARGVTIRARGRSFVRDAEPDALGELGRVRATIGREHAVEVLDVVRWFGGSYVWARVRAAW